jgi:xylose dehydrogenase (NAD/NADP)
VTSAPPVRWGFLGAGFVASRALAPAVHAADGAILQVVASRDAGRAGALEPVRVADSYEEVCTSDDVDAVYLSLPNDAHLPWVLAALAAGKHVLCEKPLALTPSEVAQMATAAANADRLLVEAAWNRWHPRMRRVDALFAQTSEPREVDAWFTFSGVSVDNYRLDMSRGGGALLDVGCYAIGAAHAVLGDDLAVFDAKCRFGPTGVDLTTEATLTSPMGSAAIVASFERPESQGLVVRSAALTVTLSPPAFTHWREPSSLQVVEDGVERIEEFESCDAYQLMVEAVSKRTRGADAWVLPVSTSLTIATAVDEIAHLANQNQKQDRATEV